MKVRWGWPTGNELMIVWMKLLNRSIEVPATFSKYCGGGGGGNGCGGVAAWRRGRGGGGGGGGEPLTTHFLPWQSMAKMMVHFSE
jgi:hypothetical protein